MTRKKVALVTGAAGGIGLATATLLARGGVTVVLLDRDREVEEATRKLAAAGSDAHALVADLLLVEEIARVTAWIERELSGTDILVNNAGIHPKTAGQVVALQDISLQEWEDVIRVNLTVPFLLCQQVIAGMKERRWGRIVNVVSRAGRTYSPRGGTHYSSTKAGLIGLTRKIAGDFAPFGITANAVAPGQVLTPLSSRFSPEVLQRAASEAPAGRLGTVDEIASAILYLASDDAAFINGAVMDVNGGAFMG